MGQVFSLVLGTHNQKKRRELELLLAGSNIQLLTLDDFQDSLTIEETGQSFAENAALKATEQAKHLGRWVLGEDSGLSVDALDGRPGVHSARFAGESATDTLNNEKLVSEMRNLPAEKRTAFYTCHMTLSDPQGKIHIDVEEYCRGRIVLQPSGSSGFGYDPYFEIIEYHRTFGELGDTIKSVLSHRARAMRVFTERLVNEVLPRFHADRQSVSQ